jgi:hypothetical protein
VPRHHIATATPDLDLCRAAGGEPALGLAMDSMGFDPDTLLLVGEADGRSVLWVERAGLALDVRGGSTEARRPDQMDFPMPRGLVALKFAGR